MTITLAKDVYYVGINDPGLTVFDIVIPTECGTTYNSYLVKGTEKTALIDCVKRSFAEDFIKRIEEIVPVGKIDYLIVNHSEPDHAGGIVDILKRNPDIQVFLTRSAKSFIDNIVNAPYKHHIVSDNEELPLGDKTLRFMVQPFLHWPDTMFTYVVEDKVLFSCDFLGRHFATEEIFDDQIEKSEKLHNAMFVYNSMIFRPFREPILQACERIKDLPIAMVAPSHGPVLRESWREVMEYYRGRAAAPMEKRKEKKVVVVYVSAYGNTTMMAKKVAEGVAAAGCTPVLVNAADVSIHKILDEFDESIGFLIGAPTLNSNLPHPVYSLLGYLVVLNVKGLTSSSFGSYGWSGEATKIVADIMTAMRIKVFPEPIRFKMTPTEQDLQTCFEFGREYAKTVGAQATA
ncbi:MAG: FprA family A-type flavoprotein [Syntrophorhabdaceae bacterium]|nr:FprA family A-type flavoprotein [Syntrophorhabdaceae bacterium]